MIRSFIAIELKNQDTIKNILSFTSRLKQNQPKIKLVEPENLHLTMKFLGNISETIAQDIYNIIKDQINAKLFKEQELTYTLKGAGQFNKFSVLWIKIEGDIPFLQNVKDQLEDRLFNNLKIQLDKRKTFKPHLTIGRLMRERINYKNFDSLKNLINKNKQTTFGTFTINGVKLKKSELTPKGPIYTDLVF